MKWSTTAMSAGHLWTVKTAVAAMYFPKSVRVDREADVVVKNLKL